MKPGPGMKIVHVLPALAPGGMERLALQLAADAVGHGDRVLVAAGPGAWAGQVAAAGAVHVALPATSRGSIAGLAAAVAHLAGCLRRTRPDVVHAHNVRAAVLSRLALTAAGPVGPRAVLLTTVHGLDPADYRAASRLLRWSSRRVIACAPAVARSLAAAGFPGERIETIVNGAALQAAGPRRQADLRRSLGLPSEPLVVGIGRLVTQKNWPVFIEAARQVPGSCFVVAGDGPLRPQLTDLARRAGRPVRFLGVVDDIAALIGLASCVVFTSDWEGLPLALLETLSLGVPVVATAVDGVADLVSPAAALLVPRGDPDAVAAAVARVLADPRLAGTLSREARAAATDWEPARMLRQYRVAYQAAARRPSLRIVSR
jgi:glycosyltransferase involved in cell wall biosynthesis